MGLLCRTNHRIFLISQGRSSHIHDHFRKVVVVFMTMHTEDYSKFLKSLIAMQPGAFSPGATTLFTWQSEEHMAQWYRCEHRPSESVRIIKVPSEYLPILHTEPGLDYSFISVAGLAVSQREDLADSRCLFHLPIERTK